MLPTSRGLLVAGIVVTALATVSCGASAVPSTVSSNVKPYTMTAYLLDENNSRVTGMATLSATGMGTPVQIVVSGPSGTYPAVIYRGRCGALQAPLPYGLPPVENGQSMSTLGAPLEAIAGLGGAITLSRSPSDLQSYVACGDIR